MENQANELSKKEKTKFNVGQGIKALGGVAIIIFTLSNNGFYTLSSSETVGYDIVTLAIIIFGGWLIYSAFKHWKK